MNVVEDLYKISRSELKQYVANLRQITPCSNCGKTPIEWHHNDHPNKPHKRVSSLIQRNSVKAILQEIAKCTPLCRSCHMRIDGRLKKLKENQPLQKGMLLPIKRCRECNKEFRPLRRGLCYSCYERKRKSKFSF